MVTTASPSPVLVLSVGHTIFRTLVETAQREGIDVNSLGVALLMLGLGRADRGGHATETRDCGRRPDNARPHGVPQLRPSTIGSWPGPLRNMRWELVHQLRLSVTVR